METKDILQKTILPRIVMDKILKWILSKEMIALIGSRQVGKTFVLYYLIQYLVNKGVEEKNIFYFDLENIDYLELLNSGVGSIIKYLREQAGLSKKYVFIDEIQYLDNPSNILKQLVDHYSNEIKLFVTGSSALTIRRKFKDSLAGRKVTFEVYSLNFNEYLKFKGEEELLVIIKKAKLNPEKTEISTITHNKLLEHFYEYAVYGGYPAVVLLESYQMKKELLNDIYNAYIKKDIRNLFYLESISSFNKLVKILALQTGGLLNVQEVSAQVGSARKTVEKYLSILQDTYICQIITPFFTNKQKEIVKMGKVFFYDTGLRNRIINDFKHAEERVDKGSLIENTVFKEIIQYSENKENVKFWRTKSGNEVDFILDEEELSAWEVKSSELSGLPMGLNYFIENYNPKFAFAVNKKRFKAISDNKRLVPFYFL